MTEEEGVALTEMGMQSTKMHRHKKFETIFSSWMDDKQSNSYLKKLVLNGSFAGLLSVFYMIVISAADIAREETGGNTFIVIQGLSVFFVASFISFIWYLSIIDPLASISIFFFKKSQHTWGERIGILIVVLAFSFGGFILGAFIPTNLSDASQLPNKFPGDTSSETQIAIMWVELVCSTFYYWALFSDLFDKTWTFGFQKAPAVLALFYLAFGYFGEVSINIWRALASIIIEANYNVVWPYFVGPILGWLLANILFFLVFANTGIEKERSKMR